MKKYQMFINGPRTDSSILSFCADTIFHGIILIFTFGCAAWSVVFDEPGGVQRKDFIKDAKKVFSEKRTQIFLSSFVGMYSVALFYEISSRWIFGLIAEGVREYVENFIK